jgi:SAM-dependent methyltransferase
VSHVYTDAFFDYIDAESLLSAQGLIGSGLDWLSPRSVLDVGCGRGPWLQYWREAGAEEVAGIDGDYVDRGKLRIPRGCFAAKDLSRPFDLGRRFDLVESLEVAEHLPPASSENFAASLCAHGDIILFSAAVPGQGGEHHVNERPLEFWRGLFAVHGYRCFDCVRPKVQNVQTIKPWYRYNVLLYVHHSKVGDLPEDIWRTEIARESRIPDPAPIAWKARRAVVSIMPRALVTLIARANARAKVVGATRRVGVS